MSNERMETTRVRRRIIYHGRVQGVGFRYTVATIAGHLPVVGYVKNLPDGTVELVVEAESCSMQGFLDQIDAALEGNITDRVVSEPIGMKELSEFRVRY